MGVLKQEQEHSVMYPIDLLKVRMRLIDRRRNGALTEDISVDPDASRQPDPGGDVQRPWQCDSNDLKS